MPKVFHLNIHGWYFNNIESNDSNDILTNLFSFIGFAVKAALGYVDLKRQIQDYFCGGSIISEYFVLTTALCARSREPPVFVRLGKVSYSNHSIQKQNKQTK